MIRKTGYSISKSLSFKKATSENFIDDSELENNNNESHTVRNLSIAGIALGAVVIGGILVSKKINNAKVLAETLKKECEAIIKKAKEDFEKLRKEKNDLKKSIDKLLDDSIYIGSPVVREWIEKKYALECKFIKLESEFKRKLYDFKYDFQKGSTFDFKNEMQSMREELEKYEKEFKSRAKSYRVNSQRNQDFSFKYRHSYNSGSGSTSGTSAGGSRSTNSGSGSTSGTGAGGSRSTNSGSGSTSGTGAGGSRSTNSGSGSTSGAGAGGSRSTNSGSGSTSGTSAGGSRSTNSGSGSTSGTSAGGNTTFNRIYSGFTESEIEILKKAGSGNYIGKSTSTVNVIARFLGITPEEAEQLINKNKSLYRKLSIKFHPDRNLDNIIMEERFKIINGIYNAKNI